MVTFNEEKHEYTSLISEDKYISATTLIHKYSKPFNVKYWSLYKALESVDMFFKKNKKMYLVSKEYDYLINIIPSYIDSTVLESAVNNILQDWKDKNENSKIKGTAYHNKRENQAIITGKGHLDGIAINVLDYKSLLNTLSLESLKNYNYFDCLPDGYYSELLLFHHDYKIAGTSDVVIIETDEQGSRWVTIDDFKTSRVINTENRYDNMLYPVNHLQDCNHVHYNLQTSLYAYMLECMGFKVKHTRITWIDDKNNQEVPYIFEYKRKEVIDILKHFRGSI